MSQRPYLSETWYRVAGLRPQLRHHTSVYRHRYRGRLWHVVQDHVSGRIHRLSRAGFIVAGLMDGARTVDAIWREAGSLIGEEAPTQDEVVELLAKLSAADLLQTQLAPDAAELLKREQRTRFHSVLQRVLNPLALRIPLWDPSWFLERTLPAVQPLFSRIGAALWLLVVLPALVLAVQHWDELSAPLSPRLLAADNVVLLAACYLVLKLLHELGHAYAVRSLGGDVHELGIMLLVLAPVPYVDASAASAFTSKRDRLLVGAAGMIVEVFLAAVALFVWLAVEDGLIRAIAYNVMLIAGVSTVIFNINPLLRFDGYYMLCDAIEIPNLSHRAKGYWAHLVEKHLFRLESPTPVDADRRERLWLLAYAPASYAYGVFVLLVIAVLVASEYLAIGVIVAIWALAIGLLLPIARIIGLMLAGPRYASRRARVVGVSGAIALGTTALLVLVPVPCHTTTEGVVWLPETAIVRARTDGFISRLRVEPGQAVEPGQPLVESEEPALTAQAATRMARVSELEARLATERFSNRARAEISAHELRLARAELADLDRRVENLLVRSPVAGTFAVMRPQDLPGRFAREGAEIGYVLPAGSRIVRAIVSQDDFELVRGRLRRVRVKLARQMSGSVEAKVIREVPGGSGQLPSKALSQAGGGALPVASNDPHGRKVALRVFQVDLELPQEHAARAAFGSRAYVRFEHDWEPIGHQVWRRVRQLLLSRLGT